MSEEIRALIAIFIISSMALFYIRPFAVKLGYSKDFRLLLDRWYVVTGIAFISGNYGLFLILETIYLKLMKPAKKENLVAVFIIVGLMLPHLSIEIPGIFGVRHFGKMDWYRFSILVLIAPTFLKLIFSKGFKFFNYFSDVLIVLFVLYIMTLDVSRSPSLSDQLRIIFFAVVDTIIPYYVISRHVNNIENLKKILFSVFVMTFIATSIAITETVRHWHLYISLWDSLGLDRAANITAYKTRSSVLRASGAYGVISLGYIVSIGFMLSYFFLGKIKSLKVKSVFFILILGILSCVSRGPWVAFAIALLVYLLLEKKVMSYIVWAGLGFVALLISPYSEKFISLLPGIGSDKEGTISYRQDLFVTSLDVISENVWLGDGEFLANSKMQYLIQGEKIIDIVNTYLQVILEYGVIALVIYILMFILPLNKLYQLSKMFQHASDERRLCHLFIAIMVMTIVVIATVSSLGGGALAFVVWIFLALISAYIKIVTSNKTATV